MLVGHSWARLSDRERETAQFDQMKTGVDKCKERNKLERVGQGGHGQGNLCGQTTGHGLEHQWGTHEIDAVD